MESCIFCRIAEGQAPADVLFADEDVVAFVDAFPKAPVHVLVIPRRHLVSLTEGVPEDSAVLGKLLLAAAEVARLTGIDSTGYRVVTNNGPGAGQSVFHLHLHVLGGRRLGWPPG